MRSQADHVGSQISPGLPGKDFWRVGRNLSSGIAGLAHLVLRSGFGMSNHPHEVTGRSFDLNRDSVFPAGPRETGHAPPKTHINFLAHSGRDVTRNVPASRLLCRDDKRAAVVRPPWSGLRPRLT